MIRYLCLVLMVLCSSPLHADIFKPDERSLTSIFTSPYNFNYETVQRKVSRRLDTDKGIAHQVKTMFSKYNVDELMRSVQSSRMMFWQYSSPAAADLFKHYHTIAYLRSGIFHDDLMGLEKGLQVDMDHLRDQSEMGCIQDKLAGGSFEGDMVDLMISCRDVKLNNSGVFAHLNYPNGSKVINVFEKVLNRQGVRGEKRQAMLDILPKWEINPDGYEIQGPIKRIGLVLSENRKELAEKMDEVLKEYMQEKMVSNEALTTLSLPEIPFTEQDVRDLLMLDPKERQQLEIGLVESLAVSRTRDQYNVAIEWLRRASTHPSLEEAYKNIVRQGMDFLEHEKFSLADKKDELGQHIVSTGHLLDSSERERLKIVGEGRYGQ